MGFALVLYQKLTENLIFVGKLAFSEKRIENILSNYAGSILQI